MRISDWSSDVCSSDLRRQRHRLQHQAEAAAARLRHALRVDQQPVGDVHHRMDMRHDRLAEGELRLRAAIGGEAGLVRLDLAEPHREADAGIADRAGDPDLVARPRAAARRSEEHTSELQSLMRISYDVFCLKKKK